MYKILTSITTERTYNFLDNNNILPTEQKGCKKRGIWLQRSVVNQQDVAGEQSYQLRKPKYFLDRLLKGI